jgi:hypothetical protein
MFRCCWQEIRSLRIGKTLASHQCPAHGFVCLMIGIEVELLHQLNDQHGLSHEAFGHSTVIILDPEAIRIAPAMPVQRLN